MNYRQNGDSFSYNIIVSNGSPYADTNVVTVIDALPAGLAYSSVEKTQGSWNAGTLTWTIPSLPGKTATQLKLWVTVTDITEGPFAITYDVTGTLTDVDLSNNTKTLTATTIARLSELNQIDLDKSVYFYLDSLPKKDFDFTIKQVGGHLSGIQRVPSTEKYSCDNNYCEKDFYKIDK